MASPRPPYNGPDRVDHPEVQHVYTEDQVPNEAKRAPTAKSMVTALSGVATLLAVIAIVVMMASANGWLGFILALAAVVVGGLAIAMAWNDARASRVAPTLATVTAGIIALVIGLDVAGADDAVRDAGNAIQPAPVQTTPIESGATR
jgi:uncharacterized membrane protein